MGGLVAVPLLPKAVLPGADMTEITANPISVLCSSFPCQAAVFRSKALEGARSF